MIFFTVFPEMIQTKRAIKLIFKNNSLKQDENAKWKHDELRLFMATAKKSITTSNESYVMKIFDLYNDSRNQPRVPVNKYTFKTTEYGWKTLNISGKFQVGELSIVSKGSTAGYDLLIAGKNPKAIEKLSHMAKNYQSVPMLIKLGYP